MLKTADELKMDERRLVRRLRSEFEALVAENERLPPHLRLAQEDFEMDPEMRTNMNKVRDAKLQQVSAEMAWELEKHTLARQKLQGRFLDEIRHRRFAVKGIRRQLQVFSYRTPKPSDAFEKLSAGVVAGVLKMMSMRARKRVASKGQAMMADGARVSIATTIAETGLDDDHSVMAALLSTLGATSSKARQQAEILKAKERKVKRQQRNKEWEALMNDQPDEKTVNPKDLEVCMFCIFDFFLKKMCVFVCVCV